MEEKINLTIPYDSGFTHVLFNIAAQGYEYIHVEYSGGGDEGGIDSINFIPNNCMKVIDNTAEFTTTEYENGVPNEQLKDIIDDQIYKQILDNANDWYNNEGGGGNLYISTLDGSYFCDHYVNVITTEESLLTGKFGDK